MGAEVHVQGALWGYVSLCRWGMRPSCHGHVYAIPGRRRPPPLLLPLAVGEASQSMNVLRVH